MKKMSAKLKRVTLFFDYRHLPHQILLAKGFLFLLMVVAGLTVSANAARPGSIERTFGVEGAATVDFGSTSDSAFSVAIQPDGKILMVGERCNNGYCNAPLDFGLTRLNNDGTLDTSFGTGGKVITDFNGEDEIARRVVLQPDGKIIVVGNGLNNNNSISLKLARYNADGSLDATFGTGGKATLASSSVIAKLLLQSDGKILVSNYVSMPGGGVFNVLLLRFNNDGSLDLSFGSGGQVTIVNTLDNAPLGQTSDGKLIVAVGSNRSDQTGFKIFRFNGNGSADTSFGQNGEVTTQFTTFGGTVLSGIGPTAMIMQPDGKFIVVGSNPNSGKPPIIRYNADGTLDSNFTLNDRILTGCGCVQNITQILLTTDGKFYTVEYFSSFTGLAITRYLANGSFDNSFGDNGNTGTSHLSRSEDIYDAALQADGKIVLAGRSSGFPDFVALRVLVTVTAPSPHGDFDGDGKTDLAVWRPSTGIWYMLNSSTGSYTAVQFGISTDRPVPQDYNRDGKTDLAVFRPSNNNWYLIPSSPGGGFCCQYPFGQTGDIPVPEDYNGDGAASFAVYHSSTGSWTSQDFNGNVTYGISTDKPVPADYDGDGIADHAVFRPSNGIWFILNSSTGVSRQVQFGASTDQPVPGDYDGDGRTDIAVYRASEGRWYILRSGDNSFVAQNWGISTDKPTPGDYDGDGKTDLAIYRPETGTWYILKSSNGSFFAQPWGVSEDIPIPNAYLPQ